MKNMRVLKSKSVGVDKKNFSRLIYTQQKLFRSGTEAYIGVVISTLH